MGPSRVSGGSGHTRAEPLRAELTMSCGGSFPDMRLPSIFPARARDYVARGLWSGELLDSYLDIAADRHPDSIALVDRDRTLTYEELRTAVSHSTAGLRAAGVRRGDTVSWILPNWLEAAVTHFAAVRLGAISNPIVPIYRHREVEFILREARSRVVIIPAVYRNFDYAAMIEDLRPQLFDLDHVFVVAGAADGRGSFEPFETLLEPRLGDGGEADGDRSAHDPALLLFTSGTTSDPKGVVHSHNTLVYENESIASFYGLTAHDVVFMPSPVAHITGLLYGVQLPPMLGSPVIFQDLWDPVHAVTLLERHGATFTVGATPFLYGLVAETAGMESPSLALRVFACGGADVPPELVRVATRQLKCCVARVYGSTEYPTLTGSSAVDALDQRAKTDGRLIGSAEMRVVDENDALVPLGAVGEIVVRGPEMFLGYLEDAEISQNAFDNDGWFHTGDLAYLNDEGYLTIVGRKKDIIIRGGENISAKEIEDLLFEHPRVTEVAIVGMPDPALVEKICAFVVLADAEPLELGDLCRLLDTKRIAKQKFPERLEVVDALPKTASGKVQKFRLREAIRAKLLAEGAL